MTLTTERTEGNGKIHSTRDIVFAYNELLDSEERQALETVSQGTELLEPEDRAEFVRASGRLVGLVEAIEEIRSQ